MNTLHDLKVEALSYCPVGFLLKGKFDINGIDKWFACTMPKHGNSMESFIESLRELANQLEGVILSEAEDESV